MWPRRVFRPIREERRIALEGLLFELATYYVERSSHVHRRCRREQGKSNILDAICFVLGISKLSQVRVDKLSDLVYKNGQAGITKASVTIVFDNADAKLSPVGYEHCKEIAVTRQVVVGGRNKHMINGRTVRSKQVHNLFHSVQLDVNNPHFLIMQGRIVKMMNMKPLEVLGLIEEAGGTRMFERKKEASLKIIEKKQRKVDEINKIIANEISPTLEKLQKDRAAYKEYTDNQMKLDRVKRQSTAYSYWRMKQVESGDSEEFRRLKSDEERLAQEESEASEEIERIGEEIVSLKAKREQVLEGTFKTLQKEENECSKRLVKANSVWQNKKDGLKVERKTHASLLSQAQDAEKAETKALNELETKASESEKAETIANELKANLAAAQKQLQALNAGMAADGDEQSQSLSKQLLEARASHKACEAEVQQLKMTRKHRVAERKRKTKQCKDAKKKQGKLLAQLKKAESKVSSVQDEVDKITYDEKEMRDVAKQVENKEAQIDELDESIETLAAKMSQFINFRYKKPSASFDRSSVKGLVGRLVNVSDESMTRAIEVAAGGKLYQVVVDTDDTAKALLKKGQLKQRVTIIPLNKIRPKCAKKEKIDMARREARKNGGDARLALDLVKYSPEVRKAMEYVFGNILVCETMKCAKAVTFNKSIKMKSVTKEGDLLNPMGTMTGGSSNSREILASLQRLDKMKVQQTRLVAELEPLRARLETLKTLGSRLDELRGDLDLKTHELSLVQKRCEGSRFGSLSAELKKLDEEITRIDADLKSTKTKESVEAKRAASLETQIAHFEESRKSQLEEKEAEIKKFKKQILKSEKKAQKVEQARQLQALELEQLRSDKESFAKQIETSEANLAELEKELAVLEAEVVKERQTYTKAKSELDSQSKAMSETDRRVRSLEKSKTKMESKRVKLRTKKKKNENEMKKFEDERKSAAKEVKKLRRLHTWIDAQEQFFGKPGTEFAFFQDKKSVAALPRTLKTLEKRQAELSQRINHKVMGMIEKAESDYAELKKKREIIKRDKNKIMTTIEELMDRKNRALKETYEKVNKDFGSMFATFLPGSLAELKPVDGKDIFKGLIPRVAFGGKWKEGLSELSGGQRSLLALSLVLAMLLFKPAPMYILDEVDAALDVCHTQNIGKLLKTHFKQSQFIIVSLKEGMFDNANVVFTTRNVDGVSSVNRTVRLSSSSSSRKIRSSQSENESSTTKSRKRGKHAHKKIPLGVSN